MMNFCKKNKPFFLIWRLSTDLFAFFLLFFLAQLIAGALVRDDVFILGDFGVPLEEISDTQVYDYCRRFNITTIVATINDFRTRAFSFRACFPIF